VTSTPPGRRHCQQSVTPLQHTRLLGSQGFEFGEECRCAIPWSAPAIVLVMLSGAPAYAAISPGSASGTTRPVSWFFTVWDATNQVTYTRDLASASSISFPTRTRRSTAHRMRCTLDLQRHRSLDAPLQRRRIQRALRRFSRRVRHGDHEQSAQQSS
jgi:hypothetical protein